MQIYTNCTYSMFNYLNYLKWKKNKETNEKKSRCEKCSEKAAQMLKLVCTKRRIQMKIKLNLHLSV